MYRQNFPTNLSRLNSKHGMGILLFGIPLLLFRSNWIALLKLPRFDNFSLFIFYLLLLLTCLISIRSAMVKLTKMPASIPICKIPNNIIITYFGIRSAFLVIYECFFRGLILFLCVQLYGFPSALMINIVLYMGVHASGDLKELVACLPFGLAICLLTIWLHSLWPAMILHLSLSGIHEFYLFYSPKQNL